METKKEKRQLSLILKYIHISKDSFHLIQLPDQHQESTSKWKEAFAFSIAHKFHANKTWLEYYI